MSWDAVPPRTHIAASPNAYQGRATPTNATAFVTPPTGDLHMKGSALATHILSIAATLVVLAAPASAVLRTPQVVLSDGGANLQPQINALNVGSIDVNTEQLDIPNWKRNVSGFGTFTLAFELGGNPERNSIGVYNSVNDLGETPPPSEMFEVFPAVAEQGWYAVAEFRADNSLVVTLFDALEVQQGAPVEYTGVDVDDFSFYIKNESTVGFGQDLLNPDFQARALVYAGTEDREGGWFLCFEDGLLVEDFAEWQDFDEAIVFLEAVHPVPVKRATWAELKSRFR